LGSLGTRQYGDLHLAQRITVAVYVGEGLPDYAEWLVLYRWNYSSGACFLGYVPVGAFTFGADRDNSTPWYPSVAAPFTFELGKAKCFHAYTYRR
jgi:hypothetical protein